MAPSEASACAKIGPCPVQPVMPLAQRDIQERHGPRWTRSWCLRVCPLWGLFHPPPRALLRRQAIENAHPAGLAIFPSPPTGHAIPVPAPAGPAGEQEALGRQHGRGSRGGRRAPRCRGKDANGLAACPHVGPSRGVQVQASPSMRRRNCRMQRFIPSRTVAPCGPPSTQSYVLSNDRGNILMSCWETASSRNIHFSKMCVGW
jgi:hypothetical protein